MLHLLPLRWIAKVLLYTTTFGVFGVTIVGLYGREHVMHDAFALMRLVLALESVIVLSVIFGWRYIPGFVDRIFPDISGTWNGFIHYGTEDEPLKKAAVLHVHQSITKIRMILETDESQSETIIALPKTDEDFSRFKIFYIFENKRKEIASKHPGQIYKGTAFIEIGPGRPTTMEGSYFTDQKKTGAISFSREPGITLRWYRRLWNGFKAFFSPRGVSPFVGSRDLGS